LKNAGRVAGLPVKGNAFPFFVLLGGLGSENVPFGI